MEEITIKVRDQFSEFPGLRLHKESPNVSGEDFYHKILNEKFYDAFKSNKHLVVDLDETAGYPPSFLDEAFGRLAFDFGLDAVKRTLIIVSKDEPSWENMIFDSTLILWERRRRENKKPVCSEDYPNKPWWHSSKNGLKQISSYDEC